MIKNEINIIILFVVAIFMCGCKPETPPNNVEDRGHEMPYTTIYTFTPGSLKNIKAGNSGKYRNYLGDEFTPIAGAEIQKVIFRFNDKNELVRTGKFVISPDIWYKLHIDFINKAGKIINYQFTENEEARSLHQFFFRTFLWEKDNANLNDMIKTQLTDSENVFIYRYGDKFKDGTLIDPPIGFDGYLKLNKKAVEDKGINKVVLNGILIHSMSANKLKYSIEEHSLVPYPFDNPGLELLGVTDIDHRFEVDIKY